MARQDGFGLVWFEKSGFIFCLMNGWMDGIREYGTSKQTKRWEGETELMGMGGD